MGGLRQGKSEQRYTADYTAKDFYQFYKYEYFVRKENNKLILADNPYNISYNTYRTILNIYNKGLIDLIINHSKDISLLGKMGSIGVRKDNDIGYIDIKTDSFVPRRAPDWDATLKYWEENPEAKEKKLLIRHKNLHTKGYYYRFCYLTKYTKFRHSKEYRFIPTRTMKLQMRDKAREGGQDYLLYNREIKDLYRKGIVTYPNKKQIEEDQED